MNNNSEHANILVIADVGRGRCTCFPIIEWDECDNLADCQARSDYEALIKFAKEILNVEPF